MRSQTLFLDSSKGTVDGQDAATWSTVIQPGLLECGPDEHMVLTVERFFTVWRWYWIPYGWGFSIVGETGFGPSFETDVSVILPEGNPTLCTMAHEIQSRANKYMPASVGFTCKFLPDTGKLEFRSERLLGLRFPNLDIARAIGFSSLEVTPNFNLFESDHPIEPLPIPAIRIDIGGITREPGAENVTNVSSVEHASPTECAALIPVDCRPFTALAWANDGNSFKIHVADKRISRLTFSAKSWEGDPLVQLGQYYLVLRVDTYRKDIIPERLQLLLDEVTTLKRLRLLEMQT